MDVRVGLLRKLSTEELMVLNCGVGEDSWESLGMQADPTRSFSLLPDWRQEEKGSTEDEMIRWHHRLNGHEFGQTPWVGDGQGGLECCGSWGCKESDMTEWLNWTEPLIIPSLPAHGIITSYLHPIPSLACETQDIFEVIDRFFNIRFSLLFHI